MALRAKLRMRKIVNGILKLDAAKKSPHPELAREARLSKDAP
jgi:hypothetical protein